ncbi:uncharacterized protein LOC126681620 [Mercurialis annua]|uniref:uncharacterized protein LOC126681620 n=1 Tax=Mercurialis annua TaxID=3986 RepID=UPI00215FD58F|nr:uncharacterized protein LOC126681620 [Mercurialis annua]
MGIVVDYCDLRDMELQKQANFSAKDFGIGRFVILVFLIQAWTFLEVLIVSFLDDLLSHLVVAFSVQLVHLEDYGGDRIDYSDWFKPDHGFDTNVEAITWAKSTAIRIGFELVISSHKNEGKKSFYDVLGVSVTEVHSQILIHSIPSDDGLSGEAKEIVRDMSAAQAKPCSIMAALKENVPSDNPTIRQVYNYRETLRKSSFEARDVAAQFYHMAQQNDYVHWTLAEEDTGVVTHIFMAHPDSVRLLRTYYWIIGMDSTYKTNKYKLPFLRLLE